MPRKVQPVVLKLASGTLASAEAHLADLLPLHDVHLVALSEHQILMPKALMTKLDAKYGPRRASALLAQAGLADPTHITWKGVLEQVARAPELTRSTVHATARASEAGRITGLESPGSESHLAPTTVDWHLSLCGVPEGWRALGKVGPGCWGGLVLGHIDTGFTHHRSLGFPAAPTIDLARSRTFPDDARAPNGLDPMTGTCGGHGTGSASICEGHDPESQFAGVAPGVPIVCTRISDCVIIDKQAREFRDAVYYLVDEVGVKVINVSMGTFSRYGAPEAIRAGVRHCYERGVIIVGAAGNVPMDNWPAFPAACPQAIAVAGVTRDSKPSSWSSRGPWVAIAAPGVEVRRASANPDSAKEYESGGFGTTFAAAMASGAALIWLKAHARKIASRYGERWQISEAFRATMQRTAIKPPDWDVNAGFGPGILNVAGLVQPNALPPVNSLTRR